MLDCSDDIVTIELRKPLQILSWHIVRLPNYFRKVQRTVEVLSRGVWLQLICIWFIGIVIRLRHWLRTTKKNTTNVKEDLQRRIRLGNLLQDREPRLCKAYLSCSLVESLKHRRLGNIKSYLSRLRDLTTAQWERHNTQLPKDIGDVILTGKNLAPRQHHQYVITLTCRVWDIHKKTLAKHAQLQIGGQCHHTANPTSFRPHHLLRPDQPRGATLLGHTKYERPAQGNMLQCVALALMENNHFLAKSLTRNG